MQVHAAAHAPPKPLSTEDSEKWVPLVGPGFTKEDDFCISIRRLQQRHGCTDMCCKDMVDTFRKYLRMDVPVNFASTDKKMQKAAGTTVMRLNGCVGCHRHVFTPDDKAKSCPHCNTPRYNSKGKPFEEVFYFPIKPKLKALLSLPVYKQMCEHECDRKNLRQGEHLMSDVYDAPAWQSFMGPATKPINRIGGCMLLLCCCKCTQDPNPRP